MNDAAATTLVSGLSRIHARGENRDGLPPGRAAPRPAPDRDAEIARRGLYRRYPHLRAVGKPVHCPSRVIRGPQPLLARTSG
ncbi:hypothetical protein [Nocardia sp. NBC_00416]|uniref:hypothetical protein n=1 Tax=Nocardia sp. NBC_00416 TaxID=2975991 RepID=UPI002E1AE84D